MSYQTEKPLLEFLDSIDPTFEHQLSHIFFERPFPVAEYRRFRTSHPSETNLLCKSILLADILSAQGVKHNKSFVIDTDDCLYSVRDLMNDGGFMRHDASAICMVILKANGVQYSGFAQRITCKKPGRFKSLLAPYSRTIHDNVGYRVVANSCHLSLGGRDFAGITRTFDDPYGANRVIDSVLFAKADMLWQGLAIDSEEFSV